MTQQETTPEAVTTEPRFVIDTTINDAEQAWLERFDRRMHYEPVTFIQNLLDLGARATWRSVELSQRHDGSVPDEDVSMTPQGTIFHYFSHRLDMSHEYDPATEAAMAANQRIIELREQLKSQTSKTVRVGQMTSKVRPDENAPDTRDELRRKHLEFYLLRIISSQLPQADTQSATA